MSFEFVDKRRVGYEQFFVLISTGFYLVQLFGIDCLKAVQLQSGCICLSPKFTVWNMLATASSLSFGQCARPSVGFQRSNPALLLFCPLMTLFLNPSG
jgi:hypothetical protein